ncbi:MAG TPA: hypothetical protein VGO93_26185, partial [Candidatus Xenobia bacterium]
IRAGNGQDRLMKALRKPGTPRVMVVADDLRASIADMVLDQVKFMTVLSFKETQGFDLKLQACMD